MLDVLRPDLWFTPYVASPDSEALNQIFEESGYDSSNIFDCLGSTFIYGMLLLLLYLIYGVLRGVKKLCDSETQYA